MSRATTTERTAVATGMGLAMVMKMAMGSFAEHLPRPKTGTLRLPEDLVGSILTD